MDKFPVNLLVYYLTQTTKLQGDIDSWHNKGIIFHPITITIFKIQHLSDSLFWQVEKKMIFKKVPYQRKNSWTIIFIPPWFHKGDFKNVSY